jgi:hypothetical protein
MYNSFELAFFWRIFFASCGLIETVVLKKHHCERRVDCKKCDGKRQRSVDCAEATKKTVQTMRYEWWGFFIAGDFCPAELPIIYVQAKPDR